MDRESKEGRGRRGQRGEKPRMHAERFMGAQAGAAPCVDKPGRGRAPCGLKGTPSEQASARSPRADRLRGALPFARWEWPFTTPDRWGPAGAQRGTPSTRHGLGRPVAGASRPYRTSPVPTQPNIETLRHCDLHLVRRQAQRVHAPSAVCFSRGDAPYIVTIWQAAHWTQPAHRGRFTTHWGGFTTQTSPCASLHTALD